DTDGPGIARTIDEALQMAENHRQTTKKTRICIIGGAEIYALFMPYCHAIYLTRVAAFVFGDTHFPAMHNWHLQEIITPDPKTAPSSNAPFYRFEHWTQAPKTRIKKP
ncbi:MAG: dihydrofolate reductase, partial [Pseudomonadota bacterium]